MSFSANSFSKIGLIGSAMEGVGSIFSGNQAKKAYDANASIAEQRAAAVRAGADLEEYKARKNAEYEVGSNTAAFAAAGVNPYSGSPVEHMTETLANANLDMAIERYNYETMAQGLESEAKLNRYTGREVRRESTFKGSTTLLKSAALYGAKNARKRGY